MFDSLTRIAEPLPARHQRFVIANGDRGTAQTIDKMQLCIDHGKRDYSQGSVHDLVGQILQGCPNKDWECYARAIFDWFRENVRYVYDANGVEVIETPAVTLRTRKGDCDSQVVALAAMYESIGMPTQIVTVKADTTRPNEFSHVYLRVYIPDQGWKAADTTMKEKPFGWEPKGFPEKTWPASKDASDIPTGDGVTRMNSLGVLACNGSKSCAPCAAKNGMGDLPIDGGVYTNENYEFYADAPEIGWIQPESNWGLGSLPIVRGMSGMRGLGALSIGQATQIVQAAVSGEARGELQAGLTRMRQKLEFTANMLNQAAASGNPDLIGAANRARNQALQENSSLQDAVNAYNALAGDIQTYSLGYYKPPLISSMGLAPIAIAGIAAAVAATSALAFAAAINAWRGNALQTDTSINALANLAQSDPRSAQTIARSTSGYISQIGDTFQAFAEGTGTILKYVLIGGAAYVAFLALRKRGKV